MTEDEWQACTNPGYLLIALHNTISDRKANLFRCALSRRLTSFPDGMDVDRFLRLAEEMADGTAAPAEVEEAGVSVERTAAGLLPWAVPGRWVELHGACVRLLFMLRKEDTYDPQINAALHYSSVTCFADRHGGPERVEAEAVACLRCLVGNPFRPVDFSPAWRTDAVYALARIMYESREFGTAPILADALQDAGCDSADLLAHLRDPNGAHVRGCWALDLVLGKE